MFTFVTNTCLNKIAGVNSDIGDKHDYKPLEQAILDRKFMQNNVHMTTNDVYVWGSNSNYTLGTGTQQQKKTPDVLNCFSRKTSVDQVILFCTNFGTSGN